MPRNYNEFYYNGAVSMFRCNPYNNVGSIVLMDEAPTPIDPAISFMVDGIIDDITHFEADIDEFGAEISAPMFTVY